MNDGTHISNRLKGQPLYDGSSNKIDYYDVVYKKNNNLDFLIHIIKDMKWLNP